MNPFIYVDSNNEIKGISTVDIGLPFDKLEVSDEIFRQHNAGDISFSDLAIENGKVYIKESPEYKKIKDASALEEIHIDTFEDYHEEFDPVFEMNKYNEKFSLYDLVVIHDEGASAVTAWLSPTVTKQITIYVADVHNPYKLYGALVVGPDNESATVEINQISDFALYMGHSYNNAKFFKVYA